MLPDFPKVRRLLSNAIREALDRMVAQKSGIIRAMPKNILQEGNKLRLERDDGSIDDGGMEGIEIEFRLEAEALRTKGFVAVIEAMDKSATEMAARQEALFLRKVEGICRAAGQSIDVKGQAFSWKNIIQSFDNMDIDFDKYGNPVLPTIVSSPSTLEKMKHIQRTDEENQEFNAMLERKRSDYRDRESRRKLVD
jgi:hypothetical protein